MGLQHNRGEEISFLMKFQFRQTTIEFPSICETAFKSELKLKMCTNIYSHSEI